MDQFYVKQMTDVLVWFDGSCPLCRREIAWMRRLDKAGAITFIDAAREDVLCPLDRREILTRFHAQENGNIVSGAAAFAVMWRAIPVMRPLGLAAKNRFILAILERTYLMFLHLRPVLQKIMLHFE